MWDGRCAFVMHMYKTIVVAFLAISCSSEFTTSGVGSSERSERDGGAVLVPPGGSCQEDAQCEPTAWPGIVDPEVGCLHNVCTFACAGNRQVIEKCEELGGTCGLAACEF